MNILILNSNTPLRDSGIAALDLFNGFRNKGHNVKLLVNQYDSNYPEDIISMETYLLLKISILKDKINRRIKFRKPVQTDHAYHFHELKEQKSYYRVKRLLKKAKIKPDVIFVLFAKDFINSKDMYNLSRLTHANIFWLMYDMAPLTGGCHYAWDCKGYQNSCGKCPGLYSNDPFDISYENLLTKKKYIDKTNIHLITASEWQYRQANLSLLFSNKPIHKSLLSVDPSIFKPLDKQLIRDKLQDNKVKPVSLHL